MVTWPSRAPNDHTHAHAYVVPRNIIMLLAGGDGVLEPAGGLFRLYYGQRDSFDPYHILQKAHRKVKALTEVSL